MPYEPEQSAPKRTVDSRPSGPRLPGWGYKGMLLLAACIWGLGTVIIKSTVDVFPAAWIVAARFLGAGVLLALFTIPQLKRHLNADHLKHGVILGGWLFLAYWLNSVGLETTTASTSAFLTALYCVMIPFLAWALRGPRPTRFNLAAAIICVAGVGFVSLGGVEGMAMKPGNFITLASALFLSFHVIYSSRYAAGRNVMVLTVIQFVVAGSLGLAMGLATGTTPDFAELDGETWVSLAYLAAFASCAALAMQNTALAHVNPATASLYLATESVFSVLFSVGLLSEQLTVLMLIGFALIFCGIVAGEYLPLRAAREQQQATHRDIERWREGD